MDESTPVLPCGDEDREVVGLVYRVERPLKSGVVVRGDDQLVALASQLSQASRNARDETMHRTGLTVCLYEQLAQGPVEIDPALGQRDMLRDPSEVVGFGPDPEPKREVAGQLRSVRKRPRALLPGRVAVDGIGPGAENPHNRAFADVAGDPLGVGATRRAVLARRRLGRRFPRLRPRGKVAEGLREGLDVTIPRGVVQGLCLDIGERPEWAWQGLPSRHLGVVHEHWDHNRPVRKRSFDLHPHQVLVRALQHTPPGAVVRSFRPVGPDDGENDVGRLERDRWCRSSTPPRWRCPACRGRLSQARSAASAHRPAGAKPTAHPCAGS